MRGLVIKVMLWGTEMGRLSWDTRRRTACFMFSRDVLGGSLDIAPIVAPISSAAARTLIYGEEGKIYQKLPSFIADSLPDDWGNRLFEFWRTERRIPSSEITPLEKLSFIGSRGMGALEFVPETEGVGGDELVNVSSLVDLAGRIFVQREEARVLPEESLTMQSLIAVGTSAGGRQPKAVVAISRETGEIRSGQLPAPEGYDYCILKFGDPTRSSAELEMTYYEMALRAGIGMAPSGLMEVDGRWHFLTRRFDRDDGGKLHTQTLAAICPDADSYDKLLGVCRRLRLPEESEEEIFRRMVFNVLANNTDDHNKNFSLVMDRTGKWSLAPAYDVTYVFNSGGYLPQEDHCLSVGGKTVGITIEDVMRFAKDNHVCRAETIVSEVAAALGSFRELARKNGVLPEWIGRVETTIAGHLREWGLLPAAVPVSFEIDGHCFENVYLEEAYRGNYHLNATVDGRARAFVIRKKTDEHSRIDEVGLANVGLEMLSELVRRFLR